MSLDAFLTTFDTEPNLVACVLRPGVPPRLMLIDKYIDLKVDSVPATELELLVSRLLPDPDWDLLESGGVLTTRHPEHAAIVSIELRSTGLEIWFHRAPA